MEADAELKEVIGKLQGVIPLLPFEQRVDLHGLYKQATHGDCTEPQPAVFDVPNRDKWNAWMKYRGMPREEARRRCLDMLKTISLDPPGTPMSSSSARTFPPEEDEEIVVRSEQLPVRNISSTSTIPSFRQNSALEDFQRTEALAPISEGRSQETATTGPSAALIRKGPLLKQRDVLSGWRERYFYLNQKMLYYYVKRGDKYPKGSIFLDTRCHVSLLKPDEKQVKKHNGRFFPFFIGHKGSSQSYRLAAASEAERDAWVDALRSAVSIQESYVESAMLQRPQPFSKIASSDEPATASPSASSRSLPLNSTQPTLAVTARAVEPSTPMSAASNDQAIEEFEEVEDPEAFIPPAEPTHRFAKLERELFERVKEAAGLSPAEFKKSGESDGVVTWVSATDMPGARGDCEIDFPPAALHAVITDFSRKGDLDSQFDSGRTVEQLAPNAKVDYLRFKGVMVTKARDFVNFAAWRVEEDGTIVHVGQSVQHPKAPEISECVRGNLEIAGWVLRPIDGGRRTKATYLMKMDPCGSIPGFVVRAVSSQQAMVVASLRQLLQQDYDEGKLQAVAPVRNENPNAPKRMVKRAVRRTQEAAAAEDTSKPDKVDEEFQTLYRKVRTAYATRRKHKFSPLSLLAIFLAPLIWFGSTHFGFQTVNILQGLSLQAFLAVVTFIFSLRFIYRAWIGPIRMSTRRKLMIGTWDRPREGNVLGAMSIDMTHTLAYIQQKREESGVKLTITHLVIKAIGLALRAVPELNGRIVMGEYVPSDTVDIGCLVKLDRTESVGKTTDLANAKITNADSKSVEDIARDLQRAADKLRRGKDEDFEKTKPLLQLLPTWAIRRLTAFVGFLGAELGISLPFIGVRPFPFGTAMVTSVGMMGLDLAYPPHTPFANVPVIVLIGSIKDQVVAEAGQPVIKPMLTLTANIDHRYLDGAQGAVLAKIVRSCLERPHIMEAKFM